MFHYSRGDAAPRRAKINDLPADNPASLSKSGSMFREEAQRLGDRRLRELGHALESRFDELRTSRFQKAWRELKISLLERV